MNLLKKSHIALAVTASVVASPVSLAAGPAVTLQPNGGPDVSTYVNDPNSDPQIPRAVLTKLLPAKIKYVFVIFNENHSFDNEFGTFPDVNGMSVTVQPFKVGPNMNSNVVDSVDHSHTGLATKLRSAASTRSRHRAACCSLPSSNDRA